jgi:hypothetical protein
VLKLNFICVSARNNRGFVALSEEIESTHGKITYHITEVTQLHVRFAMRFYVLVETKLFLDKKKKEFKEWIVDGTEM